MTAYMSNWSPLWNMDEKANLPAVVTKNSVTDFFDKYGIHAPGMIANWAKHSFGTVFRNFALISLGSQLILGFIPHLFGFERQYDYLSCLRMAIASLYTFSINPNWGLRHVLVNTCVVLWAARLGIYLTRRSRLFGTDARVRAARQKPGFKLALWLTKWVWSLVCMAPILALNTSVSGNTIFNRSYWNALPSLFTTLTSNKWSNYNLWYRFLWKTLISQTPGRFSFFALNFRDIVGIFGLWLPGFILEWYADRKISKFRIANMSNKKRTPFLHHGIFAWIRHPNFLGELMMWTGLTLSCSNVFTGWKYIAALCPLLLFLMFSNVSTKSVEYSIKRKLSVDNESVPIKDSKGKESQISFTRMYDRYLSATKSLIPFFY